MEEINQCPVCGTKQFEEFLTTTDFTVTKERFNLIRCTNCTLVITSPRPDPLGLGRYYESPDYISHSNKAQSWFDQLYTIARKLALTWKEGIVKFYSKGNSILDYGCGTGHFLAHMHSKGWSIEGVEPSEKARHIAIENTGTSHIYPTLKPTSQFYDAITLWHVLEHVPDPGATIQSLAKKLQTNGALLLAVPNISAWDSIHYHSNWAAFDTPRHLWHFNRHAMENLAAANGMKVVQIVGMKQDAFYISMLSEKYISGGTLGPKQLLKGILNGIRSNLHAAKTGEYSSLIYVLRHA